MVLTNITNNFNSIQTENKSTVSCQNTNLIEYTKKFNNSGGRIKQITNEHNFLYIKYFYNYMFRQRKVFIKLSYRTYWKKYMYILHCWKLDLNSYKYIHNISFSLIYLTFV
jgi:hypothetical protein